MLKKTIAYTDYNGVKREEDYYFNLTQAEVINLQMGVKGGLVEMLTQALKNEDSPLIMQTIRNIIRTAYGEKSADGKRFVKSAELSDAFEQTPAYSVLFMELLTQDGASDAFMRGIIPADMAAELPANTADALPDEIKRVLPQQ